MHNGPTVTEPHHDGPTISRRSQDPDKTAGWIAHAYAKESVSREIFRAGSLNLGARKVEHHYEEVPFRTVVSPRPTYARVLHCWAIAVYSALRH